MKFRNRKNKTKIFTNVGSNSRKARNYQKNQGNGYITGTEDCAQKRIHGKSGVLKMTIP